MVNVKEIELTKEQFDDVKGSMLFVDNTTGIKKDDYILFKTAESSQMAKIEAILSYDGLKDGYKLLKLRSAN